jgi:hypothetical protein
MTEKEKPSSNPASPESDGPRPGGDQATNPQINAYAIDRLSQAFETSAKRWELIVYPSLFAFIILAAYGFYLVFSLAKDVHYLAISVDSNMTVLASNMQSISDNVGQMSANVRTMAVSVESISRDVTTLEPMLQHGGPRSIRSGHDLHHRLHEQRHGRHEPQYQPAHELHELVHAVVTGAGSGPPPWTVRVCRFPSPNARREEGAGAPDPPGDNPGGKGGSS